MTVKIKKLEIYNFRSIKSISLKASDLSVLVGNNDAGKSNILRALNLFFNGETNPDEYLRFTIDHNIHSTHNRKAKEIRIKIELEIPDSYKSVNGDYIIWEKRWRASGEIINDAGYLGIRETTGPRGGKALEQVEIPARSNLHTLLRNIQFVYVPAIKDKYYFSSLRAKIYNVIAEVASDRFLESSGEFESSISEHLEELTKEVSSSIGFNSRLALPRDLSHIFESLDFLSVGHNISLDERGDGVKTRHIPIILKFMADKMHTLQVRGAQPYTFIWGYEEPENNLELASTIKMADQLCGYIGNGISQVILTTHSPIFYNLHRDKVCEDIDISCHYIYKEKDEDGTKEASNPNDLDDFMGTMKLFAPRIIELTEKIRKESQALAEAEEQLEQQSARLYVEGESDRIIIKKALEIFSPSKANKIIVTTKESGAGHSYVQDMLTAWRHTHKHHPDRPKAAGIVDADKPGKEVRVAWNEFSGNCQSAKCFQLPQPKYINPIKAAGFNIPVVLETLYPRNIWESELESNQLEETDLLGIISESVIRELIYSGSIEERIHAEWSIYIKKTFKNSRKIPIAKNIASKDDETVKETLSEFEPLIKEIVDYLFD